MQACTNRPRTALYLAITFVLAGLAMMLAASPASANIFCIGDAETEHRGGGASGNCIEIDEGGEGTETVATVEIDVPPISVEEREWNTYCSDHGAFQEGFRAELHEVAPLTDDEVGRLELELGGVHEWHTYICWLDGAGVAQDRVVVDVTGNISPKEIRDSVRALLVLPELVAVTSPPLYRHAFVHIPTWLWIDAATWSPIESSATSGITTVGVIATPTRATWVMHEDAVPVVCEGPGKAFVLPGRSKSDFNACSYTYLNSSHGYPGGSFEASVTVTWQFEWWINGVDQGEFGTVDLVTPFSIRVGEIQIVET